MYILLQQTKLGIDTSNLLQSDERNTLIHEQEQAKTYKDLTSMSQSPCGILMILAL